MSISLPNAASLEDVSSPVYFLHIPKTGGTTFQTFLSARYLPSEVCPAHLWSQLLATPAECMRQFALFRGHFYAYLHRHVPRPLRYVTIVRDPVERALSHYGHIMDTPHYLHDRAREVGSFGAYLRDPELATTVTNFQVKSLALDFDPVTIAAELSAEDLAAFKLERRMVASVPTISTRDMLSIAKHRLGQMCLVGVTERMTDVVALACHYFEWAPPANVASLNISARRPYPHEISSTDLELLRELNQADQELYEMARRRFHADFERSRLPAERSPT